MESLSLYKRLLGYITPYWRMVVLMLFSTAIYALTEPLLLKTMQPLIDHGFVDKEIPAVNLTILAIFIIILVRGAVFFLKNYSSRWVTSQVVFDIRKEMFAVLHALPTKYFDKSNSGAIISRFNYDVQQVTSASQWCVNYFSARINDHHCFTGIFVLPKLYHDTWGAFTRPGGRLYYFKGQ